MMKKITLSVMLGCFMLANLSTAHALDINLFNIDVNGPEGQRASQVYGDAYGFPAEQVTPALLGPAEEVPAILRIAQAAGTIPMSVLMMRKMGMSYSRILQTFALAPTTLLGSSVVPAAPSLGYFAPTWSQVMNPFYVQTSRVLFLRDILRIDPIAITQLPWRGIYPERAYWLPPGQAKKLGLWIPPGQAKKMWGWGPGGKGKWKVDDDDGFRIDNDDHFKEKHIVKSKNVKYYGKENSVSFKEHGKKHGKGK